MKKFLAVFLVLILVISVMPAAAMAETTPTEPVPSGGNLIISKTVEGLEKENLPAEINISLQLWEQIQDGEDENGEPVFKWAPKNDPIIVPLKLNDAGEYESASVAAGGIYEIKELGAEVDGYELYTTYSGTMTEGAPAEGNFVEISDAAQVSVAITNYYQSLYGILTLNKSFEGLPENKIPASVKWSIYNNDTDEFIQDVILSASEGWTKSIKLLAGKYRLVEDVEGCEVDGYMHHYYGVRWVNVGRGEETVDDIVNEYEEEPYFSISIPVEKHVKQTGKFAPVGDKTFDFAFSYSNRTKTNLVTADFNGVPVADKFSLTVKAGETSASGVLTITGPVSQISGLSGEISEIIPKDTGKWTYDTSVFTFVASGMAPQSVMSDDAEQPGAEKAPAYILRGDEEVDAASFVNEYKSVEISMGIAKEWKDKGSESKRPESVTVQLGYFAKDADGKDTETFVPYLVDGKKVTAVLSEKNNWKCSFDGLDSELTWTVTELDVPSGYYFYITRSEDGKTVTVINVYAATQKPKTGDNLALWAILAAASCAAACTVLFLNSKKRSNG